MGIFFWIIIFIASLSILIKAADLFTESSEKVGIALKIPAFVVGIAIISIGTSLPELSTSIIAVYRNESEIVVANAFGSNIVNILLVIGISSIFARKMSVKRSLINLDLPLLACATTIAIFVSYDGTVSFMDGFFLILAYLVYIFYIVSSKSEREVLNSRRENCNDNGDNNGGSEIHVQLPKKKWIHKWIKKVWNYKPKVKLGVILTLIFSAVLIYVGANFTIESIIQISNKLNIGASIIAMTAVAIGTSLPELAVSVRAAINKKYEIALGNVFGSNIFNVLVVTGVPALIKDLRVDETTLEIAMPFLVGSTFLYILSGMSRKIYNWEGMMYLVLYLIFLTKIFGMA